MSEPLNNLLPPASDPTAKLGHQDQPWRDVVLSGAVTDPTGNASTPAEIRTHRLATGNAHSATAADIGADEAGAAAAVGDVLIGHMNDTDNPHGTTAAGIGAIPTGEKGAANGVASLDTDGKVPSGQLPAPYTLPTASTTVLGGVKVDNVTVTIDEEGVISAAGGGGSATWVAVEGVTRVDSDTFAKAGLESLLNAGTHVRSYSGEERPTTTSEWKHHYVSAVGENAVDVIGEEIPTGGTTLFVEYSTNIRMTMDIITRKLSGFWSAATGTDLIANPVFNGKPIRNSGVTARLIGAMDIASATADTGANQPTIQITAGGTDLLAAPLTVNASLSNTGVIASGQTLSNKEMIDIDCETTGSNQDSLNINASFLIARFV